MRASGGEQWKTRGFVPDSEDDGDDDDLTSTNEPASKTTSLPGRISPRTALHQATSIDRVDRFQSDLRHADAPISSSKKRPLAAVLLRTRNSPISEAQVHGSSSSPLESMGYRSLSLLSSPPLEQFTQQGYLMNAETSSSELSELSNTPSLPASSPPETPGKRSDLSFFQAEVQLGNEEAIDFDQDADSISDKSADHILPDVCDPETLLESESFKAFGNEHEGADRESFSIEHRSGQTMGQRNLRQRKAIQLYPFQVENGIRQREAIARGLPRNFFRVTGVLAVGETHHDQLSASRSKQKTNLLSQESSLTPTTVSDGSSVTSAEAESPVSRTSPSMGAETLRRSKSLDDLPSFQEILRPQPHIVVRIGSKRRRITRENLTIEPQPIVEERRDISNTAHLGKSLSPRGQVSLSKQGPSEATNLSFRIPPALSLSPRNRSRYNRVNQGNVKVTRGDSKHALKNGRSSEFGSQSSDDLGDKRSLASQRDSSQSTQGSYCQSPSSDAKSESDPILQLHGFQKRIKGVLPASWLRLDLQAQKLKQQKRDAQLRQVQVRHALNEKGVARKVAKNSRTPVTATSNEDSESSDFSRGRAITGRQAQANPTQSQVTERLSRIQVPLIVISSSDEDIDRRQSQKNKINFARGTLAPLNTDCLMPDVADTGEYELEIEGVGNIEYMSQDPSRSPMTLPKAKVKKMHKRRKFSRSANGINRHLKYAETWLEEEDDADADAENDALQLHALRRNGPEEHVTLSILDMETPPLGSQQHEPLFLRIAKRNARQRTDRGKDDPYQKAIRLQSTDDTLDAVSSLHLWGQVKAKRVQNMTEKSHQSRQPLAKRSANLQSVLQFPLEQERKAEHPVRGEQNAAHFTEQNRFDSTLGGSDQFSSVFKATATFTSKPVRHMLKTWIRKSKNKHGLPLKTKSSLSPAQLEASASQFDSGNGTALVAAADVPETKKSRSVQNFAQSQSRSSTSVSGPSLNVPQQVKERVATTGLADARFMTSNSKMASPKKLPHRPRKGVPRRLNIERRMYGQAMGSRPLGNAVRAQAIDLDFEEEDYVKQRSISSERKFPITFDVEPLKSGTYFHDSTFIGSGDFAKCQAIRQRDISSPSCVYHFSMLDRSFHWQYWNEEVSQEIGHMFEGIFKGISAEQKVADRGFNVDFALTSLQHINRYLARSLCFSDSVDRNQFVKSMLKHTQLINHKSLDVAWTKPDSLEPTILSQLMLLCYQICAIADDDLDQQNGDHAQLLLESFGELVMNVTEGSIINILQQFHETQGRQQIREAGIRSQGYLESLVMICFLIRDSCASKDTSPRWNVMNNHFAASVERCQSLCSLEEIWQKVFLLIPLFSFDTSGLLRDRKSLDSTENWSLVKSLLTRAFVLSMNGSISKPLTNLCIRTSLARCHHLSTFWGWQSCGIILNEVFDFFAQRGLANLSSEVANRSPLFLERLDIEPTYEVRPEDTAFHIFLRLLAQEISSLRKIRSNKDVQHIVWRFVPSHGRTYPKDQVIRQEDLDALRNHHDLLSVLYWSSPPNSRPRLELLERLVDHATSHREACRLSVRAWSNLARFEMATSECSDSLLPLMQWFSRIAEKTLALYFTAQTEAKHQQFAARAEGGIELSDELVCHIIDKNQRKVLSTFTELIRGLRSALSVTKSQDVALAAVRSSRISITFDLLKINSDLVTVSLLEAIGVYSELLKIKSVLQNQQASRNNNNESQEYGEWPDITDWQDCDDEHGPEIVDKVPSELLQISSSIEDHVVCAFGLQQPPSDTVLRALVDVWTISAASLVRLGGRVWEAYIVPHGAHSWSKLGQTAQSSAFAPYFYSRILASNPDAFEGNKDTLVSAWVLSLVERESALKFQHLLTSSLLSLHDSHPLLQDLPFAANRTGEYDISLQDLRARRLTLLGRVLSSMRSACISEPHSERNKFRQSCRVLLKQIMAVMRTKYMELRVISTSTDAYIQFVQSVVELLQASTSDICPIDPFFTDSTAFPLPASDPTYMVGRLKSYASNPSKTKVGKDLAMFIQNSAERAAVDKQQSYLVEQLARAMLPSKEANDKNSMSLFLQLMCAVFPPYLELCVSQPCGWILAEPIIEAITKVFEDLTYTNFLQDDAGVNSTIPVLNVFFTAICSAVSTLSKDATSLQDPNSVMVVSLLFRTASVALTIVDYLVRSSPTLETSPETIRLFSSINALSRAAQTILQGTAFPLPEAIHEEDPRFHVVLQFTRKQLENSLAKSWKRQGNQYSVTVGNLRRLVTTVDKDLEAETRNLSREIERFRVLCMGLHGLRVCWPDVEYGLEVNLPRHVRTLVL